MEMPPDTLEAVGVNELFVTVTVDASFTTEQGSLPRPLSNDQLFCLCSDLRRCLEFSGQLFLETWSDAKETKRPVCT